MKSEEVRSGDLLVSDYGAVVVVIEACPDWVEFADVYGRHTVCKWHHVTIGRWRPARDEDFASLSSVQRDRLQYWKLRIRFERELG